MAKVSYGLDQFYEPKLGFVEGFAEIVEARTQVFQFPPNKESGDQFAPFLAAVLLFQPTNQDGVATSEQPLEKVFRIEKDLTKMRPAHAASADDPDPEDLGSELDTIGNCIFTESGAKINVNSSWANFVKTLANCGFDAGILANSYLPDLVGTKGHFATVKGEKRSIQGRDVEPTMLIADKITVRPYDPKGKKAAAGASKANGTDKSATKLTAVKATKDVEPAATAATPATSAVSTSTASTSAAAPNEDVESTATVILAELAGDLKGQQRDKQKVFGLAYSRLLKDKSRDKKQDKPIQDLWHDDEWLTTKGDDLGYLYSEGVFSFGADAASA